MANLGFTLMAIIAAAVLAASCQTQPRSLFADVAPQQAAQTTEIES